MSFSSTVKTELTKNIPENECCRRAYLYGLALFGRSFSVNEMAIKTETAEIATTYKSLMEELCKVKVQIKYSPSGQATASVNSKEGAEKVVDFFGHSKREVTLKINHSNFDCDDCTDAFFAGAFLSCGTVSAPSKDYHLEFVVPYLNLSKSLMKLMSTFDLEPKFTRRKGYSVVYFKESESIEECLYRMGAHSSAFEIMNIKVLKDFRNKANRVANCETANINRMVNAVAPQILAINKIIKKKGLNYLPEELREIAQIRLDNPEASLQEMSGLTKDKLSRSGVNHRLKKIEKIAEEM